MKTTKKIIFTIFVSAIISVFIPVLTKAQITKTEKESLKYMYEEEKLAFDVYTFLSERYDLFIFDNISKSEKYHISLVENLLKEFNVGYVKNDVGIFENKELQKLYKKLTDKGNQNLIAALEVGATIEDVDIFDLEKYISETENQKIKNVFEMLKCASGNHTRAFSGQLKMHKITYKPKYLTEIKYKEILNSEHKRCFENH